MTTRCERCGYVRKATDQNPAWECPACRIAYVKATATTAPFAQIVEPRESSTTRRVTLALVGVAVAAALIVGGAWAYQRQLDAARAATYARDEAALMGLMDRQIGEEKLAGVTPRIALSNRVATLQALHREATALQVESACLKPAQTQLSQSLEASVRGWMAFMSSAEDSGLPDRTQSAERHVDALETIKGCRALFLLKR